MNKDKIKKLVHGNFRCYFSQTKPCVGIVEIINIPVYLNGELSLCTFRSEVFDKELKSKLILLIDNLNLLNYRMCKNIKEPIYILDSNKLVTSFYLLEMTQNNFKITLDNKNNKDEILEILIPSEIAKAITEEFRTNNNSRCINWLTKDEMLKNDREG